MTSAKQARMQLARRLVVLAIGVSAALLITTGQALAVSDTSQFSVTAGTLAFDTNPNVPDFGTLTLNGSSQTLNATMNSWQAHDATGSGSGWNVTVQGDAAALKSAVFKEYCTDGTATNGCNTAVSGGPGPGYVTTSPRALAANSLTLNSTSASFAAIGGSAGSAPTHSCGSTCNVDSASAVKIASAATNAGMGTFQATGYTGTSLALATPSNVYAIGVTNKVYRVDLIHTLNSGP